MKKTLAILLSLALILCMMPSAVFAETAPKVEVTLNKAFATYNGSVQKPTVTSVKVDGKTETNWTVGYGEGDYISAGTYTVTVSGENFTGTAVYKINQVDLVRATITMDGSVTTSDVDTAAGKLKESSLSKVSVTQDGQDITGYCTLDSKVTGSVVRITATSDPAEGNANVAASSKFADFTVKNEMSDYVIAAIPEQTYTGKAIQPSVTVKSLDGRTTLSRTNYTVTYSNNVEAGSSAMVTVTGTGNYTGSIYGTFVIGQRNLASSGITVSVADAVYRNGNSITPDVTVTDGSKILVKGSDYIVSCSDTAIGRATATIEGIGNYKGIVTKQFNIVDTKNAISYTNTWIKVNGVDYYKTYYNGTEQKPSVTVYVGESEKTAVKLSSSYYDVQYVDNKGPGVATVIITGKGGYAGSTFATFTILETEMTDLNTVIKGYDASYAYTGSYITPVVTVSVNGRTLVKGTDYTVEYLNNRYMSTTYSKAQIVITAIPGSGYTGSVTATFTIAGRSLSDCTASFTNGRNYASYTGKSIYPAVTVKADRYTTLKEDTDYVVSYLDSKGKTVGSMVDAGKYTVVISGINSYSGKLYLDFTINGVDISGYTVTLRNSSVKADGTAKTPVIESVKMGSSSALYSTDYEVTYEDSTGKEVTSMKTPGTYKVVVTGKNGYSGSTYATFRIVGTPQEIKIAKTSYKVYKDSESFKINATATGDGTGFSYVSSNPEVATVSANGVVTIHKLGRAKITVTTTGMKLSEPASDDVYVKVYPDKAKITQKPQTEGNKGSFRVRWEKQDDVTYYEIRYARNSKFTSGTYLTKKVNASTLNYTTQSTKITGLKSGAKYYVKVRAVKVVTNDYGQQRKYYGTWSNWRSVVTK